MPKSVPAPQWLAYAKPGPWQTKLSSSDEAEFQSWVRENRIPWKDSPTSDYDMRGFWQAQKLGDSSAQRNPITLHFPDTWKTPYHTTFSNESIYAKSEAGYWGERDVFIPPMWPPIHPLVGR